MAIVRIVRKHENRYRDDKGDDALICTSRTLFKYYPEFACHLGLSSYSYAQSTRENSDISSKFTNEPISQKHGVLFQVTFHTMLQAAGHGGRLLLEESWRRMAWLQKECFLVLGGTGGGGGGKDRVLGVGRGGGWRVKTGEAGEGSGEERVDKADGEVGETSSEPEFEEEEPETKTENKTEMSQSKHRIKKGKEHKLLVLNLQILISVSFTSAFFIICSTTQKTSSN